MIPEGGEDLLGGLEVRDDEVAVVGAVVTVTMKRKGTPPEPMNYVN